MGGAAQRWPDPPSSRAYCSAAELLERLAQRLERRRVARDLDDLAVHDADAVAVARTTEQNDHRTCHLVDVEPIRLIPAPLPLLLVAMGISSFVTVVTKAAKSFQRRIRAAMLKRTLLAAVHAPPRRRRLRAETAPHARDAVSDEARRDAVDQSRRQVGRLLGHRAVVRRQGTGHRPLGRPRLGRQRASRARSRR